jgi:3-deoxy-D-arabino-heptulosonate 7-phosphate (DAHP) synthase
MRNEKEGLGQLDRRRLLKGAALAVGAAGAACAVAADSAVAASDGRKPQKAGYRETESVKTYYRSARF